MKIFVLNGWAASSDAWSLCRFMKGDVQLFSYVDQLAGLPEQALDAVEKVILVGWSMGASGALRLALRNPEKIHKLILIAPTPRMMEEKSTGWVGMSKHRLKALEMGLKLTKGAGFFGFPEDKPNPYCIDCEANLSRGLDYLEQTDLRADLEATFGAAHPPAFPVVIFQSERDGIVRAANATYLKDKVFLAAQVELIAGGEHALSIYIPEQIDQAVLS